MFDCLVCSLGVFGLNACKNDGLFKMIERKKESVVIQTISNGYKTIQAYSSTGILVFISCDPIVDTPVLFEYYDN